ncbi:MAG: acylphosphatase [Candidatus Binatia bacterium]
MSESPVQQARVALHIKGRVQGVGYRFSVVDEAQRLQLTGWVRNTHDGAVELVAEGAQVRLQRLVTWCHRGPRGALVTEVEQRWLPYAGQFDGFRIRR